MTRGQDRALEIQGRIIEGLGEGLTLKTAISAAGGRAATVAHWRRALYPEFDQRVKEVLASAEYRARRAARKARLDAARVAERVTHVAEARRALERPATWMDVFLEYYEGKLDRVGAADAAGVRLSEVIGHLDPRDERYDETFARDTQEIELRAAVSLEDKLRRDAAGGGNATVVRQALASYGRLQEAPAAKDAPKGDEPAGPLTGEALTRALAILRGVSDDAAA